LVDTFDLIILDSRPDACVAAQRGLKAVTADRENPLGMLA